MHHVLVNLQLRLLYIEGHCLRWGSGANRLSSQLRWVYFKFLDTKSSQDWKMRRRNNCPLCQLVVFRKANGFQPSGWGRFQPGRSSPCSPQHVWSWHFQGWSDTLCRASSPYSSSNANHSWQPMGIYIETVHYWSLNHYNYTVRLWHPWGQRIPQRGQILPSLQPP